MQLKTTYNLHTAMNENEIALHTLKVIRTLLAAFVLFTLIYPLASFNLEAGVNAAGVVIALSMAALVTGGFLGFLFGIPKTSYSRQSDSVGVDYETISFRVNGNFEQISDWLSKIIVGLGLAQLTSVIAFVNEVGSGVSGSTGNIFCPIFTNSAQVFMFTLGFLYSYLWTRLFISRSFKESDTALSRRAERQLFVKTVMNTLERTKENVSSSAEASGASFDVEPYLQFPDLIKRIRSQISDAESELEGLVLAEPYNPTEEPEHD